MDEKELEFAGAETAAPDLKKAKNAFSHLGFSLLAFFAVITVLQIAGNYLMTLPGMPATPLVQWLITYIVPLYVIGVPVTVLIMRKVPAERREPQSLRFGQLLKYMLMCLPIMYAGNIIGTLLSMMFTSGTSQNPLESVVMESSWIQAVVLAVLAPIFEEFIFRKQLIDRIGRYGEKTAIFFSALTFALFHGNLYQFFYAFGLGLLFAWIYTRTRKLRYSVILHMFVNFLGSVVAPWVVSQANLGDTAALTDAIANGNMGGAMIFGVYVLLLVGFSIAGLVLLIKNRKSFVLQPTAEQLPKGTGFKTSCLNAGVILFTILCLGMFVFALFGAGLM